MIKIMELLAAPPNFCTSRQAFVNKFPQPTCLYKKEVFSDFLYFYPELFASAESEGIINMMNMNTMYAD